MDTIRPLTTITALGLAATGWAAGIATAADLLQAPTGPEAGDPGAWTPVVARSYEQHYTDVQCVTLPAPVETAATYDLGTAPSGEWFFAIVEAETGTYQYGPAELSGTRVPTGAGATGVIGCHGLPATTAADEESPGTGDADSARQASTADDGSAATPAPAPSAPPTPGPSPSAPSAVPATVTSGLQGGRSGLVALGVGAVLVAGLALLGRRARP